ncbi:Trimethyllysine dioxygenase, partial [Conidiobolus coronatus NRRL 28638]
WLRDQCKCPKCFSSQYKTRTFSPSLFEKVLVKQEPEVLDNSKLHVVWEDGHNAEHHSEYPLDWIFEHHLDTSSLANRIDKVLWTPKSLKDLPMVDFNDVMNTEQGLKDWVNQIYQYGICFVKNIPYKDTKDTKLLMERISHLRNTHFGEFWQFTSNNAFNDLAYTTEYLDLHTDSAYFTDASGLQMFHLTHFDGKGGESTFMDGFNAAQILKSKFPEYYKVLTQVKLYTDYYEDDQTIAPVAPSPILNLHPDSGELYQIQYNPQHQNIKYHPNNSKLINLFYEAQLEWYKLLSDRENTLTIPLTPGMGVIFDNWRVLHGRLGFTGKRTMCGAYIGRDDFMSKVRVLNK